MADLQTDRAWPADHWRASAPSEGDLEAARPPCPKIDMALVFFFATGGAASVLRSTGVVQNADSVRLRRCGPFVLGRCIGSGGMASVFAARQSGPRGVGRLVAVKLMSRAIAGDPAVEAMFLREA